MRTQATGARSLFSLFSSKESVLLLFFLKKRNRSPFFLFRRKKWSACTGSAGPQTDGRRHILRCRRSEYHSGYASLLRLVFARVRRACASAFPCKPTTQKKIICGTGILYTPAVFPNALHKTDGSYVNRPFFRSKQDVRENVFSQIDHLSRSVFCFFSSRKEIVPFFSF